MVHGQQNIEYPVEQQKKENAITLFEICRSKDNNRSTRWEDE
jgi:hypothetical protein